MRAVNYYYVNDFVFIYPAVSYCPPPYIFKNFPQGENRHEEFSFSDNMIKTFFFFYESFVCVRTLHLGCILKSFAIDGILVTVSILPPGLLFLQCNAVGFPLLLKNKTAELCVPTDSLLSENNYGAFSADEQIFISTHVIGTH